MCVAPLRVVARLARSLRIGLVSALLAMSAHAALPPGFESSYADLRELRDLLDVARALGSDRAPDGRPLAEIERLYGELHRRFAAELRGLDADSDPSALAAIRIAIANGLPPPDARPPLDGQTEEALCGHSAGEPETDLDALRARVYACYGAAQSRVRYDEKTIDRLTVFARLASTADRDERQRLFLALAPVWESVNGDGSPTSPYRRMIALSAERWRTGDSYVDRNLAALGVEPAAAETWLTEVLAAWRAATPGDPIEPWDLHFAGGTLSRALGDRVPLDRLRPLNDDFYRSLGADPEPLGVRFDLAPRPGKTPVAFTTFGRRPRRTDRGWKPGEAWILATYSTGGFDNLVELLHETGHAIHIQAIRTRPAFAEWPDSDTLTEALAELVAQEAYEPAWQKRWLGTAAPLADSLRSKYSAVMLDICWALFEIRMHRDPAADPNRIWTELTHDYLRVTPHPEWSWWAMRGQLVESPGYMMNYALGAVIVADLRARMRELRGPLVDGGPDTYAWLSERLYRFGLERSSREVLEAFLGRALSPAALLADLHRMQPVAEPPPVALAGGTLLDLSEGGRRGRDLSDSIVVIDHGRIVAAGRRGEVAIPSTANVVDISGRFVLPGLIDGFAGMNSAAQARAYLYSGVTSIVGVGGGRRGELAFEVRPRPRIFPLEAVGYDEDGDPEIEPDAVRRRVGLLARDGVRVALLMYPLPAESLAAAVERARELGLATIGELGETPYETGLALGVDAVVHTSRYALPIAPADLRARVAAAPFGPPKLDYYRWLIAHHREGETAVHWAQRLAQSDTALIPTLAMEYLDLPGHRNPWLEPAARILDPDGIHLPADPKTGDRVERPGEGADAFPADLAETLVAIERRNAAAGARYLAGSGTSAFGTMPGISLRHELELLVRIGMTPRQAISAATANYRDAFGWRDVGCSAPGCLADLLVLRRDPTVDIQALDDIELLIVAGEPLDREALLAP